MELRKFVACTVCVLTTAAAAAGCADGTGQALTPTLPSADTSASNADGTKLKASAPQPLSPQSAIRVSNLTPQLVLQNRYRQLRTVRLPLVCVRAVRGQRIGADARAEDRSDTCERRSDDVYCSSRYVEAEQDVRLARVCDVYNGVQGSLSDGVSFRTPLPRRRSDGPGPVPCDGSSGPAIIACVGSGVPEKLVKTSTATSASSVARRTWSSSATASSRPAYARA